MVIDIDIQWVTVIFVTLFCVLDLVFKGVLIYLIINIRVSIDTITLLSKYFINGSNE